ncbi:MAG: PKD domain-containing protein, partial [Roseicyclus sp.]|nr:PKD domain-containing protein [Roseicyclus sp.]
MFGRLGRITAMALALLAGGAAERAEAFGGSPITYTFGALPSGGVEDHCPGLWEAWFSAPNDATIRFKPGASSPVTEIAGGQDIFIGTYRPSVPPISASGINAGCGNLSNVVIISQNGVDSSDIAADDYIGVVFEADYTDGLRYRYELALSGATDTVLINTRTQVAVNTAPVADAGPSQTVAPGAAVSLDGSGSGDADGDPLTYAWSQTGGTAVTGFPSTQQDPSFIAPDAVGMLIFSLTVNDGQTNSSLSSVAVTTDASRNQPPVAEAGPDQTVASGAPVSLTAAGSRDVEPGQSLTYSWTKTAGPDITLTGATSATPSFLAPTLAAGAPNAVITLQVTVSDGYATAMDTVTITVTAPPNRPPVADAGADRSVASAASVTLDGRGSSDPDPSQTLSYAWSQTAGPSVTLADATSATPG